MYVYMAHLYSQVAVHVVDKVASVYRGTPDKSAFHSSTSFSSSLPCLPALLPSLPMLSALSTTERPDISGG